MDAKRWAQIEELYHRALECPAEERRRFIAKACEHDTALRRELESLLAHTATVETFLERPAMEIAAPVLIDAHAGQYGLETEPAPKDFSLPRDSGARFRSHPPWWMYLIAASFLAHAVFITAFCFFGPESMGIEVMSGEVHPIVRKVTRDSPAERAGMQTGDVLIRANHRFIANTNDWYWFLTNIEAGQPIMLETARRGRRLHTVLVLKSRPAQYWSTGQGVVLLLNLSGQYLALALAFFMAFLRPTHLLACIGALFLAVYSSVVLVPLDGFDSMWRQWPFWCQAFLWAGNVLNSFGLGIWFTFFALFPRPSFHNRRVWAIVWIPTFVLSLVYNYQIWHFIYLPENMIPSAWMSVVLAACWITYLPTSFAMLAIKYRRLKDETERRRVRLFVVPLALVVALAVPEFVYSQPDYSASPGASLFLSFPVRALATLAGVAFPLCFAYAILRHRLFDIRVIVRQGIRYAAAKQLLLLAAPAIIAAFFADIYAHRDRRVDNILQDRGWIYLGLAALAVLAHIRRNRWLRSLDRRFFREQYNAQNILRSTLEQVRAATNLADVAPTVVKQIHAAMHPVFCAIFDRQPVDTTYGIVSIFPDRFSPPILPARNKIVEFTKLLAKPVQFSAEDGWLTRKVPPAEIESLRSSGVDLLAPVRNSGIDAFIALGRKRSEEPYTSDDLRLIEDLTIGLALLPSPTSVKDFGSGSSKECPVCGRCYEISEEFCAGDGSQLTTNSFPRCLSGRFRIEYRIGRGGMGLVYEATDLQLQRKVAVKLILDDSIKDSTMLDRFRREAHVLANFQHSNAVTLFDAGVMSEGRPFLVMERLVGRTLREELNRRTKLPGDEVHAIVRQLCAGLSAAHRRSLIHRDLKPENIFLCSDDTDGVVKILDFGLAKLLMEAAGSTQSVGFSTIAGQIAGTPAYMAPELLLGAKPERGCDLWALAVITFEMLTGERPSFLRTGALTDSCAGHLPECWREFFIWSLAHEPGQRPQNVDIFLERFDQSFLVG